MTESREYRLTGNAYTRQREEKVNLLKEWEKILDRNLASVMKELADVNVENACLWWFCRNVDEMIEELGADVGSALKAVAESAQQNVAQVVQSVMPFSLSTGSI